MPIYEYVCTECAHTFDALQKMSDAPLSDCPCCEKSALKKKISAPSFRLSGSGWYETDFKSGNKKNLANSESPGKTPDTGSKDKSGDDATKTPVKDSAVSKDAAA